MDVGSFATLIDKYLIDPIVRRIKILRNSSHNIKEMQEKVCELIAARNDVWKEAEGVGQVMTDKGENWFKVVDEIQLEANGIEERRRHRQTSCVNCCSFYKLNNKSIYLKQKAAGMLNPPFELTKRPPPESVIEIESEPTENLQPTTQHMLQNMIDNLLGDPENMIIGVHGMGGVGKTTLAEKVNNHFKGNSCFETVIMVTVSATPDISKIQTRIGERLGLDLPKDVNLAKEKLLVELRKKKFLIILDDVWDRLELKGIGIPHLQIHNGSKILITSRYLDTCTNMLLVDELGCLRAVRNRGEAMIKSLKIASMLEDGKFQGSAKMHDMMRELAIMITTSSGSNDNPQFLTRTGGSFEKAPHANEWPEATRISLIDTQIKTLPDLGERCPKLTTLLLRENQILAVVPKLNFFQRMDHLHVLDLSSSSTLEYLPDSLSHLVNLRVLRLPSCLKLRALPALGMLRQLQVLDLKYCHRIDQQILGSKCFDSSCKSLDLSINLRYLDVSCTQVSIPAGVISHHLLKLEGLHLNLTRKIKWGQRGEGNNKEERRSGLCSSDEGHHRPSIIDVGELSRLTHLSSLQILLEDITISDWFKPLAYKIMGLDLQSCTFIKQDAIKPLYESEHLLWLTISKCRGLTCVTCCAW
ncbi:hypothetical protein NE237_025430 [Protea cynaroides]|uniref:NB-ARC domain-containing protein n=1 Tax=Protea cynaroides TaxID=273540 RepID=A0A9Q0H348_9MAGN|nr:hypothetical protein NE237_025430 [Protea cynaroides]